MNSELHPKLIEGGHHALVRLVNKHLAEAPKPRLKPGDRNVLEPAKRLDCMSCLAVCCHVAGYVELSLMDAQRLADHLGITIGQFLDSHTEAYDGARVIKKFGERCQFLDSDNRCTVYSARPETCRNYLCWRGDLITNNVARVLGAGVIEPTNAKGG